MLGIMTDMQTDDDALAQGRERVTALRASLEASEGRPVRLVETHISWVLLADSLAYKLKKPVRLPFLDFTTLAARRRFCEEELRLNWRLAPSLYLDVVDVCDSRRVRGSGQAVQPEIALERVIQPERGGERRLRPQLVGHAAHRRQQARRQRFHVRHRQGPSRRIRRPVKLIYRGHARFDGGCASAGLVRHQAISASQPRRSSPCMQPRHKLTERKVGAPRTRIL